MLIIRKEQIQAFEQAAMVRFEKEMAAHCKAFSTRLCEVIGNGQVYLAIRQAIDRCSAYGFTNRGPIRLFIEAALLFGSAFDTDPQYAWSTKILNASSEQMVRAEKLYDRIIEYQAKVPAIEPADVIKALEDLSGLAKKHPSDSITQFTAAMLGEMDRLSHKKTAYTGSAPLTDLILEGCTQAEKNRLSTAFGQAMTGMLMFAFGHGFMADPLHPWAQTFLAQAPPGDPEIRARQLQKDALAFLRQLRPSSHERHTP